MVENIFFSHLAHLLVSYQQLLQSCSIWLSGHEMWQVFFGQNITCEDAGLPVHGVAPAVRIGDAVRVLKSVSISEIMA